ncbi:TIGR03086 family metal-binding protein [Micromonospora chersina]|uniref:TIGR03086 family metal-binding protein n=1 Tax=Micromonospora chersina TaxID=47854 RepID=UPI0033C2FCD8
MTDSDGTPDFEPAARALGTLLPGVSDDQLSCPTPCEGWTVSDLLGHVMGLTVAFRIAAEKGPDAAPDGPGDRPELDPEWRSRLPAQLDELVGAWREPAAWTGETAAGGVVLPAEIMGIVALNELVVHGWDLASATGQPYVVDHQTAEAVHRLVSQQASSDGTPGLFGPSMTLPADAPIFDRVLGLTGRDPGWKA